MDNQVRISGKYIEPIHPKIYAGVGGFKELDRKYKEWRASDANG